MVSDKDRTPLRALSIHQRVMTTAPQDWTGIELGAGRYRVLRRIGRGGMSAVYLAHDRTLEREVALKVPSAELIETPRFAQRFAREVRSLVKLTHPHVVKVLDVGEHAGVPYIVMQHLSGGTLARRRPLGPDKRPRPMSPRTLAAWLAPIGGALDFIHRQGFIHRDVKPANVLFDAHGHAYLSDFGLAKALEHDAPPPPDSDEDDGIAEDDGTCEDIGPMTSPGALVGTLPYMAPELLLHDQFDGRVDQYALAVVAYELLCGRRPFAGKSRRELIKQQALDEPPALSSRVAGLPEGTAAAIHRALSKDPEQRFLTCSAFTKAVIAPLMERGPILVEQLPPPLDSSAIPSDGALGASESDPFGGTIQLDLDSALDDPAPSKGRPSPRSLLALGMASAAAIAVAFVIWQRGARDARGHLPRPLAPRLVTASRPPGPAAAPACPPPAPAAATPNAGAPPEKAAEPPKAEIALTPVDPNLPPSETNSLGMELALIRPGRFFMGSSAGETDAQANEQPRREVVITRPFYIGRHEVTVGQFLRFLKDTRYLTESERHGGFTWESQQQPVSRSDPARNVWTPGYPQSNEHPATFIDWDAAVAFCNWLGSNEHARYRLPTEAEWEYCCRAGTDTPWSFGDDPKLLSEYAHIRPVDGEEMPKTAPVGRRKPNPWGLFDFHGNIAEWCLDPYAEDYHDATPVIDPRVRIEGAQAKRVLRGGSYVWSEPGLFRSAYRDGLIPAKLGVEYAGFRVVREIGDGRGQGGEKKPGNRIAPGARRESRRRD